MITKLGLFSDRQLSKMRSLNNDFLGFGDRKIVKITPLAIAKIARYHTTKHMTT
ncbi:MAG: hypothetical protein QNJ54_37300 [Prochloraceae cyanobacterium]|nr:hypothetical protein [Prochloraceae cyanobacterium]